MELFGIGPLELLFIITIALIVVGPRDIGKFARSAGRFINRLYKSETWKMLTDASRNLRTLPNRLAREAALEELDEAKDAFTKAKKDLAKDIQSVDEGLKAWTPASSDLDDSQDKPLSSSEDPSTEAPGSA